MVSLTPAVAAALAGLGFGFSLIVAIGAQNVFVLRQGLQRSHVGLVVVLCAASDTVLIAAGVGGLGSVLAGMPGVVAAVRWLGAAVVLAYGALAARRAWLGTGELAVPDAVPTLPVAAPVAAVVPAVVPAVTVPDSATGTASGAASGTASGTVAGGRRRAVVATTLALTWLNPHVYLDTVVLMGGLGSTYGDLRWWFAAGAVVASWAWFAGLGYGARLLRPLLARPSAWRVVDGVIALVMLAVAVSLVGGA